MLYGAVTRGTTPKHEFELPFPASFVKDLRITYSQKGNVIFSRTLDDCQLVDNILSIQLTQEDTFQLSHNKLLEIEIRALLIDGQVVSGGEPIKLKVIDTINNEVLE